MKISDIARLVEGKLYGDPSFEITAVASVESAGPNDLAYVEGAHAATTAASSKAGCLLVPDGVALAGRTTIVVRLPKLALARAATALHPEVRPAAGVHPTAVVSANAQLAKDCSVGPHVVIESGVKVGAGTVLKAGVFLAQDVRIGENCVLHPRVAVYVGAEIGDRVVLHAGVVVGSDGFGYVFAGGRHIKFPQLGNIVIEDDVEIGSNTTLDRGSLGTTRIGQGTKIDNLVQIAHNVKIGRHCVIASQVGISGSSEIGDYVVMAGQVGVGDHAYIEDQVIVGGQAGVLPGKIVRKGSVVWGTPCRPMSAFKKTVARLARLDSLSEKVKVLAQQMEKLAG